MGQRRQRRDGCLAVRGKNGDRNAAAMLARIHRVVEHLSGVAESRDARAKAVAERLDEIVVIRATRAARLRQTIRRFVPARSAPVQHAVNIRPRHQRARRGPGGVDGLRQQQRQRKRHRLVLLCYERYAADWSFAVRAYAGRWQHGQWESRLLNAIAIRTRIVAIECGT